MAKTSILLAEGRLNWCRYERVGDRYGTVTIQDEAAAASGDDCGYATFDGAPLGARGTLVAEVIATRPSPHIGDFARDAGPEMPAVGERIVLATGHLFRENPGGAWQSGRAHGIGVQPKAGAIHDGIRPWMRPERLYRAHFQTVRLIFEMES